MKLQRIAAGLLSILAAGSALISCGSEKPTTETPKDSTKQETEAPVSEAEEVKDIWHGLAAEDYGGAAFNLLVRDTIVDEFYTDRENGDAYNDVIYRRNRLVEERYNIKINAIPISCSWTEIAQWQKTVSASVLAGDGAYDLIDCYAILVGPVAMSGILYNLNDIPNLRLDESWWSSLVRNTMTVNGKYYGAAGDIATNLWDQMQVMFFSKTLAGQYDVDPYKMVKDGTWTYDNFAASLKGVYRDVNGDSVRDPGDIYGGISWDTLAFENLHNAFGMKYATPGSDGRLVLDNYNEDVVALFDKIDDLLHKNPDFLFMNEETPEGEEKARTVFAENRALYFFDTLYGAKSLRSMSEDFGIIPVPKRDEAQKEYYTTSRDARSMMVIPVDVKDPAYSGMITEALCVAGHEVVL
ncbi:MAG: extracellular solute-binding protein, partial [Clostridia bacterium]|nr:extracellular solute-binding protein [Clostridia bacterium]